jgi:UDP-N-acetylglucosamine--N-acetylmuramyl-(pentapeptide) pyrophosphoryl-undecaprenol N-acetylglucosamine transferase
MSVARETNAPFVVLAAGGTGGHVFPAEALAQELLAQGARLALITDRRGSSYGGTLGLIETHHIHAAGLAGRGVWGLIQGAAALAAGTLQSMVLLRRLKPSVVVGFGGYAAAPPVLAATLLGIRTVLHEQNAVLGRANRLMAARVDRICTSFELARPAPARATVVRTGMPVRPAVAAARATSYRPPTSDGPFRILVLGGSQGARIFSDVVPAAVALLPEAFRHRAEISQQCRPEDIDRTLAAYAETGAHVELRHFFENVPELMAKAHLVVTRAGASSVSEVAVAGRPAILVPYQFATDDHQTANAKALVAVGGAWMLPQAALTAEALAARLGALALNPEELANVAAAALGFSIPDAAHRLALVVTGLTRGENGAPAVSGRSPSGRDRMSIVPPIDHAKRGVA